MHRLRLRSASLEGDDVHQLRRLETPGGGPQIAERLRRSDECHVGARVDVECEPALDRLLGSPCSCGRVPVAPKLNIRLRARQLVANGACNAEYIQLACPQAQVDARRADPEPSQRRNSALSGRTGDSNAWRSSARPQAARVWPRRPRSGFERLKNEGIQSADRMSIFINSLLH